MSRCNCLTVFFEDTQWSNLFGFHEQRQAAKVNIFIWIADHSTGRIFNYKFFPFYLHPYKLRQFHWQNIDFYYKNFFDLNCEETDCDSIFYAFRWTRDYVAFSFHSGTMLATVFVGEHLRALTWHWSDAGVMKPVLQIVQWYGIRSECFRRCSVRCSIRLNVLPQMLQACRFVACTIKCFFNWDRPENAMPHWGQSSFLSFEWHSMCRLM